MSATPRTDEAWAKRFDYHDISPWSLCMKLEIELAETDQKWERRLIVALGGHVDSKLWGDDGLIAATWRCVEGYEKMEKELAEARDQLEGAGKLMGACDALVRQLAEAKSEAEKWEKLHDQDTEHLASLQQRDNYGPTETLNETAIRLAGELAEARKQRDALAEAANEYMKRHMRRGFVATTEIRKLQQALAAVKGGSDD
jgi:hypothetical protein